MKADLQLEGDVINAIRRAPALSGSEIGVALKGGVVTLSGTVASYREKEAARICTESVDGVLGVADEIVLKSLAPDAGNDTAIAHKAVVALLYDIEVPEGCVKVAVEDGVVELVGEVEWDYQRRAAGAAVGNIPEIQGLKNSITVKRRSQ